MHKGPSELTVTDESISPKDRSVGGVINLLQPCRIQIMNSGAEIHPKADSIFRFSSSVLRYRSNLLLIVGWTLLIYKNDVSDLKLPSPRGYTSPSKYAILK